MQLWDHRRMPRITIELPEDILERVDALALRQGKTRNEVIIDAISWYIAKYDQNSPQRQTEGDSRNADS
jgi:metal-responsive CopG/Arc/MetJ family transcriptional regulator